MSNATVVERVTALEPTTRDDFADEPSAAPTETDREPASKSDHRHAAQQREPARARRDRRALQR
jgi:hypothetical protein